VSAGPAIARDLARRTHGNFVSIDGASHMVQIDAPDALAAAVEAFLAAHPAPG